jgi:hypothetical protein
VICEIRIYSASHLVRRAENHGQPEKNALLSRAHILKTFRLPTSPEKPKVTAKLNMEKVLFELFGAVFSFSRPGRLHQPLRLLFQRHARVRRSAQMSKRLDSARTTEKKLKTSIGHEL